MASVLRVAHRTPAFQHSQSVPDDWGDLDLMVHVQETIELTLNWDWYNLNFSQNGLTSAYSLGSLLGGAFCGGFNLDTYEDREQIILTWPDIDQAYRNELLLALRYQREVVSTFQGAFNLNSHAAKHDLIDLMDIDDDDKAEKHNSLSNMSLFAGGFAKPLAVSLARLQTDEFSHLTDKKAEDVAGKLANQAMHGSNFGKDIGPRLLELQGRQDLSDADKAKHATGFRNQAIFGSKTSIQDRLTAISSRPDLDGHQQAAFIAKVKMPGLKVLGVAAMLASPSTTPSEIRAATGKLASLEASAKLRAQNPLLDEVNELWKLVVAEAPEISFLDESSPLKKNWWLKKWAPDEAINPPKCMEWASKLKAKAVEDRIAHYVNSPAPEARHKKLRTLLPRLQVAMTAYRRAKNSKSHANSK